MNSIYHDELKALTLLDRNYNYPNRLIPALKEFNFKNIKNIVDIGAGTMAKEGKKILGDLYVPVDHGNSYTVGKKENEILDKAVNFEKNELPFGDCQFQNTICLDVLEHLDDPYKVLKNLFRITEEKLVVSLPNNWVGFYRSILLGENVTHRAGYGLPKVSHLVGQRHKYFFNYTEAREFLIANVDPSFEIVKVIPRYDMGQDSIIPFLFPRIMRRIFGRLMSSTPAFLYCDSIRKKNGLKLIIAGIFAAPLFLLEHIIFLVYSGLILRSPLRLFNFNCRGIVVVYQRKNLSNMM